MVYIYILVIYWYTSLQYTSVAFQRVLIELPTPTHPPSLTEKKPTPQTTRSPVGRGGRSPDPRSEGHPRGPSLQGPAERSHGRPWRRTGVLGGTKRGESG